LGCGKSWIDPVKGGFIGSATREDSEKYAKVEAEPGYEMFWATEEDFNKIFRRRP